MSEALRKLPAAEDLYEIDFYRWTQDQARLLSDRRGHALDAVNLIDEVESLGRSQRAAIESHLRVLLIHLLTFLVQPERATPSWRRTLWNQRREITRLLTRSPSLRGYPAEVLAETYDDAVRGAVQETNLDKSRFPADLPFTLEQLLDPEFEPR